MKIKITKYKLSGLISMIVFWLLALNLNKRSELQHIFLMAAVMLIACAAAFVLLSVRLSPAGKSWCMAVPFAVIGLIANYALDANCVLPFYILAVMAICAQRAKDIAKKEKYPLRPIMTLAGLGISSIIIFTAALLCFSVTM